MSVESKLNWLRYLPVQNTQMEGQTSWDIHQWLHSIILHLERKSWFFQFENKSQQELSCFRSCCFHFLNFGQYSHSWLDDMLWWNEFFHKKENSIHLVDNQNIQKWTFLYCCLHQKLLENYILYSIRDHQKWFTLC